MNDLTAFQRDALVVIAAGEKYGLAIKRALETLYDDDVNHGRLYPNLDKLIRYGYVEKREIDKRTNGYSITDEGLEAISDQLGFVFQHLHEGNRLGDVLDESKGKMKSTSPILAPLNDLDDSDDDGKVDTVGKIRKD